MNKKVLSLAKLFIAVVIVLSAHPKNYAPALADSFYPNGYIEDSQLRVSFVYGVSGHDLLYYDQGEFMAAVGDIGLYARYTNSSGHDIWVDSVWLFAEQQLFINLEPSLYRELYYIKSSGQVLSVSGSSIYYDKRFRIPQGVTIQKIGDVGYFSRISIADATVDFDEAIRKYRVRILLKNNSDFPVHGAIGTTNISITARSTFLYEQFFSTIDDVPSFVNVAVAALPCAEQPSSQVRLAVSRDDIDSSYWGGLIVNDVNMAGYYCASLASYDVPILFAAGDHQTGTVLVSATERIALLAGISSLLQVELQEVGELRNDALCAHLILPRDIVPFVQLTGAACCTPGDARRCRIDKYVSLLSKNGASTAGDYAIAVTSGDSRAVTLLHVPRYGQVVDEPSRIREVASGTINKASVFSADHRRGLVCWRVSDAIKSIEYQLVQKFRYLRKRIQSAKKFLRESLLLYLLFLVIAIIFAISFQPKGSVLPKKSE
jgi:hypothetical protein